MMALFSPRTFNTFDSLHMRFSFFGLHFVGIGFLRLILPNILLSTIFGTILSNMPFLLALVADDVWVGLLPILVSFG